MAHLIRRCTHSISPSSLISKVSATILPVPNFKLNTGAEIPAIGLGTWQSSPGEVANAVKVALQNGYKHLDLAWIYGNSIEVAQGIRESGVPRSEIFLTDKLWCTAHRNPSAAIDETLRLLGVDYLDLYLIHWPIPMNADGNDPKFPRLADGSRDLDTERTIAATWKDLEAVLASGRVKAIGVSNFSEDFLAELLKTAVVVPAVNQIELHPYLPQHKLITYLESKNIVPQAYSPLGSTSSPLLQDEEILSIAKKYNVGVGTVLISYQIARNVVVLPKSVTDKRIIDNLLYIKLDDADMRLLNGLNLTKAQRFVKPDWGVDLKFEDWTV